jgi:GMP synthase-like glutamine amidotransferase
MRALYINHDHASSGGFVALRLRERGWDVDERVVVPAERYDSPGVSFGFPDPAGYDLLIPGGAPWGAYDDELIGSWLGPELHWLRAAVAADIPVLAICFGAQALARALGGKAEPNDRPEIGYVAVESDVPELIGPGPWFQWHFDRFAVPPGAREVARNDTAPQAYVLGRSLAVQFHPEVSPEIVASWLANGGDEEARKHGIDPDSLLRDAEREGPAARQRAATLVDAYLESIPRS